MRRAQGSPALCRRFSTPTFGLRNESIDDVARQSAGRDDNDIEADFAIGVPRMACEPQSGGGQDALPRSFGHGLQRRIYAGARLDLDKDQDAAAARDNVDFAERGFPAPG